MGPFHPVDDIVERENFEALALAGAHEAIEHVIEDL